MKQTTDGLVRAPTDLSNFLSCRHLSALELQAARGELERPYRYDPVLEDLRARGLAHERAYLEHLRAQGLMIAGASKTEDGTSAYSKKATLAAMREGVDVVYQATLEDHLWSGRVDFLHRVDVPSSLGDWSYEPYDTKLARATKAGTILQLCVYAYLLEKAQGVRPGYMHVVTPATKFEPMSYRVDDFGAYFRLLERDIEQFLTKPSETYPEMVSHCDYCAWWSECEARRRDDDNLCYVAGISRVQIKDLQALGINQLGQLATLDPVPCPPHGSKETLARLRDQAGIQVLGRERKQPEHRIKEPLDGEHGLALLPEPSSHDIFLDFEGDHFAEHGVREYLLGYVTRGSDGAPTYTALWANTREEERTAFERFLDLATENRACHPSAHIYHFGSYEPAALKRLMGRYATRETELDELLRGRALVDLHMVVKRALIASVERYSIKELEPFFGYEREQNLREATMSRRIIETALAVGDISETLVAHRRIVEDYNREDCESASRLRDWLEQLRAEAIVGGHELPRPAAESGEASEAVGILDRELQRLRDGLLWGVPSEPGDRTTDEQARFALAHMMEFHRREDKASWWEYFRILAVEDEELKEERRALAGLSFLEQIDDKRAPLQRYLFPNQEVDVREKDDVFDCDGTKIGKVHAVSYFERTIDIKKMVRTADRHPTDIVLHNIVPSDPLRKSLMRFGQAVLERGFSPGAPYRAAIELLVRRPPPLAESETSLQYSSEETINAACRIALSLDHSVLAIQGPPGTGKTHTGAHIICELVRAGLRVGVTAVSHKVIVNLLESAAERAQGDGTCISIVHRQEGEYEGELRIRRETSYESIRADLESGEIDVLGATAWCWARGDFEQSVDVLIVDEAGQMSLANVLATAPAGRSLVLLGDPQQLEQPLQSSHPEGSEVSALYHLLDGEETMPANKGLFLAETYRLHPAIAKFTSEIYYQGKVRALAGLERQAVVPKGDSVSALTGSGLVYVPVRHTGNQAKSTEEVDEIKGLVDDLIRCCYWQDKDGNVEPLTERHILVIAPYNAQVSALIEALPALNGRIGTVDRFQGQEAPIVIYSMTSSSPEDAPRGMEFLYNRFRFNVATSRARALCILVGSPELFRPECRTPHQMKMANGFCRYLELANRIEGP